MAIDCTFSNDGKDWEDWVSLDWGNETNDVQGHVGSIALSKSQETWSFGPSAFDFTKPLGAASAPSNPVNLPYPQVDFSIASEARSTEFSPRTSGFLPDIAEGLPQQRSSPPSEADSYFGLQAQPLSLPEIAAATSQPGKKRKTTSTPSGGEQGGPTCKRTRGRSLHSKVEQRYREKLNSQLAALRDCIPEFREDGMGNGDGQNEGCTAASKKQVNKGKILDKATEYIVKLQADNNRLANEVKAMRKQLAQIRRSSTSPVPSVQAESRVREPFTRLAMAAFAGMMATESFHTTDQSDSRALFALPTRMLGQFTSGLQRLLPVHWTNSSAETLTYMVRLLLLFSVVGCVIYPSVFGRAKAGSKAESSSRDAATTTAITRHTVSAADRRDTFQSASQLVWIPESGFAAECAAIALTIPRLVLQHVGVPIGAAPSWLTCRTLGSTPQETKAAHAKAWDLVLDTQLLGGDTDLNARRLLLTLLCTASLPKTPLRQMLMAVHARVLLWRLRGSFIGRLARGQVGTIVRHCWERARELSRQQSGGDELPRHLCRLLQLDAEDVLTSTVVRRVDKLAQQQPSNPATGSVEDSVGCDTSVRSPLDAVAAFWVASSVRKLLVEFLEVEAGEDKDDDVHCLYEQEREKSLERLLEIAPPDSGIFVYATVVRAVLAVNDPRRHCDAALRVLRGDGGVKPQEQGTSGTEGKQCWKFQADISLALRVTIATALLHSQASDRATILLVSQLKRTPEVLGLVGFVALYRFLAAALRDKKIVSRNAMALELVAGMVRRGAGSEAPGRTRRSVVRLCIRAFESLTG